MSTTVNVTSRQYTITAVSADADAKREGDTLKIRRLVTKASANTSDVMFTVNLGAGVLAADFDGALLAAPVAGCVLTTNVTANPNAKVLAYTCAGLPASPATVKDFTMTADDGTCTISDAVKIGVAYNKGYSLALPANLAAPLALDVCQIDDETMQQVQVDFAGEGITKASIDIAYEKPAGTGPVTCLLANTTSNTSATYNCSNIPVGKTNVTFTIVDGDDSE